NSILTDADRAQYYRTVAKLYDMSQELAYMVYEMDEILLKAEEVSKSGGNKTADVVIKDLNELKETLVITTGDNYVASAEPQLRSKIGELYSKIASGFEPPSASEKENLSLLDERYEKARNDFSYIKSKKVPKMEKYMEGKGITEIKIKSYEEFIDN
ncbi:MAG: hypothetical protein AB8B73_10845, partial [Ekhidna sp.]